jgi:hypothetical protein
MRNFIALLVMSLLLISCDNWLGEQGMPIARGESGEIILVLDSARWSGEIGKELRLTFRELVAGLPREEPLFDLRQVVPTDFKGLLKQAKNLVLFIPLNDKNNEGLKMKNLFTQKSLDSLQQNPDIFLINRSNLFASGQQVLFLIHHDDQSFKERIVKEREQIRYFFNNVEDKRTFERLFKAPEEKMISNKLQSDYGYTIRIPYGFRVASSDDGFAWLRLAGQEIDKNIFIAFKDYTDANAFRDEDIIHWRDEICHSHLYGNPENPESYLLTEMLDPPIFSEVNFNGKYAKKMLGRWKTNTVSMGGPFVSYTLVDETTNRIYYIEGFIYSPGVEQRKLMREMNVILKTFQAGPD